MTLLWLQYTVEQSGPQWEKGDSWEAKKTAFPAVAGVKAGSSTTHFYASGSIEMHPSPG
jgi:hypothetical protein